MRLPPALVGPPAAGLVLRSCEETVVAEDGARSCADVRGHAAPGRGRARHVVQLGALAVRDARLARRHPELRAFYPTDVLVTARDIIYLWVARMIMTGLEFLGEEPVLRRLHPLRDPGPRRPADVEEPRHRDRPARADRLPRRRRPSLRPAGDVLEPGRPLLRGEGPAGPRPGQQALERLAADPAQRRRRRARRRGEPGRGPLDPLPARAHDRLGRRALDAYDFAHAALELYASSIRALRLVPGDRQAAALRGRATTAAANLLHVLERTLALAHPAMPFVTEEIWSYLPDRRGRLIVAASRARRGASTPAPRPRSARRSS